MRIKITEAQAKLLENIKSSKVLKISETQLRMLQELESGTIQTEMDSITKQFVSQMPKGAKAEHIRNVSKETKIKGLNETESLWEEFVNELYGINESGENKYEKLIKLMESCGYVENRKLSKVAFEGNKELAKEVIVTGLNKLQECGSPYTAVETMENIVNRFKSSARGEFEKKPEIRFSDDEKEADRIKKRAIELQRRRNTGEIKEIDGEEERTEDEIDTVTMDIPLLIRALEYAKEDANNDMDLHTVAQKAIELSKQTGVLTMDNYADIFTTPENGELNENGGKKIDKMKLISDIQTYNDENPGNALTYTDNVGFTQSPWTLMSFIENGNPSRYYLEKIASAIGKDISEYEYELAPRPTHTSNDNSTVDPRDYGSLDEDSIDEITAMGGASGVFGGDGINPESGGSTYPVVPLGHNKEDEQLEESGGIGSVGAYDTPGFASSDFFGNAGKKGKALVNKGVTHKQTMIPGGKFVKENALNDTQWSGGEMVTFDDCTKLNNNKEAQKGKCSVGAIDNVVKTKKTKTSVISPSLDKKQGE